MQHFPDEVIFSRSILSPMADGSVNTPSLLDDGYNLRSRWVGKRKRGSSQRTTHQPPPKQMTLCEQRPRARFTVDMSNEDLEFNANGLSWSKKALEYFNLKEATEYEYVETTEVYATNSGIVHMNFKGKSVCDGSTPLFFAEVLIALAEEGFGVEVVEVKGCCILEKTDKVDRDYRRCDLSDKHIIHPGPRYGHRSAHGDKFEDSLFQTTFWRMPGFYYGD